MFEGYFVGMLAVFMPEPDSIFRWPIQLRVALWCYWPLAAESDITNISICYLSYCLNVSFSLSVTKSKVQNNIKRGATTPVVYLKMS